MRAVEHDDRITALLEFDFDDGTISVKEQGDSEWRTYRLKDVSTAVYRAERKSTIPIAARELIFEEALRDREIDGSLPNRQKKQRRQFRRCDAKRNTPMSRLSAPCCDFVGEVEEVSLPPVVCEAFAARAKAGSAHGKATVPRCGYRVENQAGERDGAAWRPRPSSLRPAEPAASRLSAASERNGITVPELGKRFLDRCFNSRKAQKFQRMMRCFGRFL